MHLSQDLQPWMENTPQPVALAMGRVVRAIGQSERLDACIKAAEVITRFLAVVSLASAAATRPKDSSPPEVDGFVDNLSFGVFEKAARASTVVMWSHPLQEQLRLCFKSTKRHKATVGPQLESFVRLRNELGHSITPANQARARAILEREDPIGRLLEILVGLKTILDCPLLVLLGQEHRRGRLTGQFAFFAGEGEPIPQELNLLDPVYEWDIPYLCTPTGLIPLAPGLQYLPGSPYGQLGLYLLDGITRDSMRYKSVHESNSIVKTDGVEDIGTWLSLPFAASEAVSHPMLEPITCLDGRSLYGYLSGEDRPQVELARESEPERAYIQSDSDTLRIASVRDFELRLDGLALGIAYRDILYCLAGYGARAELRGDGLRVITNADPDHVVATINLTPANVLRVAFFPGALTSREGDEVEEYGLRPGEVADQVIDHMQSLLRENIGAKGESHA